jgi:hypothetical protein
MRTYKKEKGEKKQEKTKKNCEGFALFVNL